MAEISYLIPDLLDGKVKISSPYQNYNARGNPTSYGIDMFFEEMLLSKSIKAADYRLLGGKIEETLRNWERKYTRQLEIQHKNKQANSVEELNAQAREAIEALGGILAHTLTVNDAVDWNSIKRKDVFRIKPESMFKDNKCPEYVLFNNHGQPMSFEKMSFPEEPTYEQVRNRYGLLSRLFRKQAISDEYAKKYSQWQKNVKQTKKENIFREKWYKKIVDFYKAKKSAFEEEKRRDNEALDNISIRYQKADPKAIEEYCDLVLSNSEYPDYFPKDWVLEYREKSRMVVVDYSLLSPEQLPKVESYSYIKARDEIKEKLIAEITLKKMYDNVIYQICIRTIHELFEADVINAIDLVAFNGLVTNINPATGISETKVIISVAAEKDKFLTYDLSKVDPKATFKHLKGVAAVSLVDLTPIPPVIKLDKTDKRFIEGKAIAEELSESVNLASMDWEDFEHLIRELFEQEFAANGGEVKVTRASSDGGVDAVAFDPDPIRGGKIVIQAKRYTNIVGVSAVRDLYGTVMNEGATKGILVTTSDYGKDSYLFAKDKPITLINGSNLLSLLEKHGHKARINIAEAKKLL